MRPLRQRIERFFAGIMRCSTDRSNLNSLDSPPVQLRFGNFDASNASDQCQSLYNMVEAIPLQFIPLVSMDSGIGNLVPTGLSSGGGRMNPQRKRL
jgi:hypothetical protein